LTFAHTTWNGIPHCPDPEKELDLSPPLSLAFPRQLKQSFRESMSEQARDFLLHGGFLEKRGVSISVPTHTAVELD